MISFDQKTQTFYLCSKTISYLMQVRYGRLEHVYFGAPIGGEDVRALVLHYGRGFSPNPPPYHGDYSLDTEAQEFSGYGGGDYRTPLVAVEYEGGATANFQYRSYEVLKEKPKPEGLPALREGETLLITLEDDSAGLEAKLYYTVYDEGAVARRTEIVNIGKRSVRLAKCMSGGLELSGRGFEIVTLTGRYLQERGVTRTRLTNGIFSVSSMRGASSHARNPFAAIVRPETSEESGEVYGVQLIYSGNFLIEAETDAIGNTRVAAGVHPMFAGTVLEADEAFVSPELVLMYSCNGIGGMSRAFHDLYRNRLIPPQFAHASRPVVLNNWESTYFDFDEEKLLEIIRAAKELGAETFVLDDGWFGRRDNDLSSLGDWFENKKKLPHGLSRVISCCKENGMKFGLWFEPEMISRDSELYRRHSDWCIQTGEREPAVGRGQFVLDFSRREVVDAIYAAMRRILSENDISYIKWDMNRNLTDVPSFRLFHQYVLGVYRLYEMLRGEFPNVLIEGCSGGGGRFDAGILYYSPQIWTSDNSDAYARCAIQYGTSLCYPLSTLSNHVSVCPNHQTNRVTPLSTRAAVASLGVYGYELNPNALSEEERRQVAAETKAYREIDALILSGDLYRLRSPFDSDEFCMEVAAKDQSRAYVVYVKGHCFGNDPAERLRLRGLTEDALYCVRETGGTYEGKTLMRFGLPVPLPNGDFDSVRFTVERV